MKTTIEISDSLLREPASLPRAKASLCGPWWNAGARRPDRRVVRQHGVRELWSADRDFGRFAGLKVVNPLLDVDAN